MSLLPVANIVINIVNNFKMHTLMSLLTDQCLTSEQGLRNTRDVFVEDL